MAYNEDNLVVVGSKTLKANYDQVLANANALRDANPRLPLGGLYPDVYTNTGYTDLFGPVHLPIDGTNLSGFTVKIVCMARVVAGTGYIKLYNITLAADVASSETSFTNTSADKIESSAITLAAGTNEYKLLVKGVAATDLVHVWDAVLSFT